MRPTLLLQPIHNSSADILRNFIQDKPLSSDQLNFLEWHQIELSNTEMDPVLNYYLQSIKNKNNKFRNTFLLDYEIINFETIEALKKRLKETLKTPSDHLIVHLSQKQLIQFRELNKHFITYYRSNQLVSSAFFHPSGTPPLIYFCWGKYFGVFKYVLSWNHLNKLEVSIIVYFENMMDRHLKKCIEDYGVRLKNNIALQKEMMLEEKIPLTPPPRFTFSDNFLIHSV